MTTLSITHYAAWRIDDDVDSVMSTLPVDLSAACQVQADGSGLVSGKSRTDFSDNLFRIEVSITSEDPWSFDNKVEAEINYVFRPSDPWLNVSMTGLSGDHAFESGSYFLLTELDTAGPRVLDERSWEYEMGFGFIDDVLPYQASYLLVPGRDYQLTLGAYGTLGDLRQGFAELECFVNPVVAVPAPGALALLALGTGFVAGMRHRRKRNGTTNEHE
jgi:hypothetical protein